LNLFWLFVITLCKLVGYCLNVKLYTSMTAVDLFIYNTYSKLIKVSVK